MEKIGAAVTRIAVGNLISDGKRKSVSRASAGSGPSAKVAETPRKIGVIFCWLPAWEVAGVLEV